MNKVDLAVSVRQKPMGHPHYEDGGGVHVRDII